jgi:HK97 family phage portal protein
MGLWRVRELKFFGANDLVAQRTGARTLTTGVTVDSAMRNSAVWACLRLRANLMSSFPVDLFRRVQGVQVEVPKPTVLVTPGGPRVGMGEWMYSSQVDLDRLGNTIGHASELDGAGRPARIDLWPAGEVSVLGRGRDVEGYRYRGTVYDPPDVWHEKQYTVAGLHVGLSPVAFAAWTLAEYASVQDFALNWFGNGAVPSAVLKNTKKTLNPDESAEIKRRYKATVGAGDVFVTGADWEYDLIQAEVAASNWLESKGASLVDIARFFDVPADLIDAALSGQSITYANMTQRNLQFLIMHLGPAVVRRETALSSLTPAPRFVKLNTAALLRMDPAAQAVMLGQMVADRIMAPSEARALLEHGPFTDEQLAEFDRLFGRPSDKPAGPALKAAGTGLSQIEAS